MSKDLGPPNKQPQHLIIASTVRPPVLTESHPGIIPGSESNRGLNEERFREVGPRVLSAADGQVLGSVAFLLLPFGERRAAVQRCSEESALNAQC